MKLKPSRQRSEMQVDENLIKKIASLAKIKLSEEEVKEFIPQFNEILEYFSKLNEVDVKNIAPRFQPIEIKNAVREDKREKCLTQEEALKNTQHKKNGYFKGPRII